MADSKFITHTEPLDHYNFKWYCLGLILSGIVGLVGIIQTQWFVSLLKHPETRTIRTHITNCRQIQDKLGVSYCTRQGKTLERKIEFHSQLFTEPQIKRLEQVKDSLINDEALQAELQQKFGESFKDETVVVVPAWKMDTIDNNYLIGITREGWEESTTSKGESDVGGFTVRDREPPKEPRTLDGRPRIFLNPNAFGSARMLKLTLFHEMLHAMNVPGYYPSRLIFAQNDLTYLAEYRNYVKQENLEGRRELWIWALAVLMPWLIFLLIARRAWAVRPSMAR